MGRIIDINNRLILMRAIEDREPNPRLKRAIHSSYVRYRQILVQEKEHIIRHELLLPKIAKCKLSFWGRVKRSLTVLVWHVILRINNYNIMNYIEQRIKQLDEQLNNPECTNPLKVEHKLEAYKEMQQQEYNK